MVLRRLYGYPVFPQKKHLQKSGVGIATHSFIQFFKENTMGVVKEMGPKSPKGDLGSNPVTSRSVPVLPIELQIASGY
jgi:hypothetical protein